MSKKKKHTKRNGGGKTSVSQQKPAIQIRSERWISNLQKRLDYLNGHRGERAEKISDRIGDILLCLLPFLLVQTEHETFFWSVAGATLFMPVFSIMLRYLRIKKANLPFSFVPKKGNRWILVRYIVFALCLIVVFEKATGLSRI